MKRRRHIGTSGVMEEEHDATLHRRTGLSRRPGVPKHDEAAAALNVANRNAELGVTWIHSFVSEDRKKTFCVYDAPDQEAIRRAASGNSLPVGRITRVNVLDSCFFK
jgi:hypothetical protein